MKRLILCVLSLLCGAAFGRQTPAKPQFEVASIKPAQPMPMGQMRIGMNADAGMLRYTNVTLKDCIRVAYRVKDFQVEGPDWLGSARFDIVAKLPEGASKDQIPEMLQSMLADRFKLTVHRDTKEHAIYALEVAKGGPKLKPAETSVPADAPAMTKSPQEKAPPGGMRPNAMFMRMDPGGMHLEAPSATLDALAEMISRFCERPVVDMTGIQGEYAFDLAFVPETMRGLPPPMGHPMPPPGGGPSGGPIGGKDGPMLAGGEHPPADAPTEAAGSIYDAVGRYGLKLAPRKAPLEIVFVDHIERAPTEN